MSSSLSCFKAYDVRGKLGDELNEDIAYRIGRAYAEVLNAKKVVVGADVRLTSEALKASLARGLMDAGADVVDIGLAGTEEVYFSAFHLDVDGGIEVTASHNPMDYNGMKFVGRGAIPISKENGLSDIQALAESRQYKEIAHKVSLSRLNILNDYVQHVLGYVDWKNFKPVKIVCNAGNGAAGHVIDAIENIFNLNKIPVQFVKINNEPNGNFPRGIPNPLLPESRQDTVDAVVAHHADMGLAWDGDFDRCFFFDHQGGFIEGYYIVGLLAEAILANQPGEKIIYDPRLTWNTEAILQRDGGVPVRCKSGHAFMKECMRNNEVLYGGEMSAHHYFRDFSCCDSGMIPWLLVTELMCRSGKKLSELVGERVDMYPCSGEINRKVADSAAVLAELGKKYADGEQDHLDGLSVAYDNWRFNVRVSNTEPVMRLNVETKGDKELLAAKTAELLEVIGGEEA